MIEIFGRPHHAMFVRVVQSSEGWIGSNDPHDRVSDIYRLYDVPLIPVEIPGIDGHWFCCIHPWGD